MQTLRQKSQIYCTCKKKKSNKCVLYFVQLTFIPIWSQLLCWNYFICSIFYAFFTNITIFITLFTQNRPHQLRLMLFVMLDLSPLKPSLFPFRMWTVSFIFQFWQISYTLINCWSNACPLCPLFLDNWGLLWSVSTSHSATAQVWVIDTDCSNFPNTLLFQDLTHILCIVSLLTACHRWPQSFYHSIKRTFCEKKYLGSYSWVSKDK